MVIAATRGETVTIQQRHVRSVDELRDGLLGSRRATVERNGSTGAVILDKDGVLTDISGQIDAGLRFHFGKHADPAMGITYDFERKDVYKLFGVDPRYNDGIAPILALIALNIAAQNNDHTPTQLLRQIVESNDAVHQLDALRERHIDSSAHSAHYHQKAHSMYWWNTVDGYFRSEGAMAHIKPYVSHNGSSRDSVVALLDAGVPVGIVTNAPNHDLEAAGFSARDISRLVVITRKEMGEERMKPDPFGMDLVVQRLAQQHEIPISRGRSIMVGDTRADIRFALNGGVIPVGVRSGMGSEVHLMEEHPHVTMVDDLPKLAHALLRTSV